MSERAQTETVLFTSSSPKNWCLTRRGDLPWMCLTIARTDNQMVVGSIDTNDVDKIKESISSSIDRLFIKAIHILVPTSSGISSAEVLDLVEARFNGAVAFHSLVTKFGATQIDGTLDLLPHQTEDFTYTSIYKKNSLPSENKGEQ